jgi:hypothetical protein
MEVEDRDMPSTQQPDLEFPFFAYGIFKPGQLAFFQLSEFVYGSQPLQVPGTLLLRHGLPIADLRGPGHIRGALLMFRPGSGAEAYGRISAMEPDEHYFWSRIQVNGGRVNVLAGRSPEKGRSVVCYRGDWDGWQDPLLTEALEVAGEVLTERQELEYGSLKQLFRLQMGYLLLWTSVERYVSLRYNLGHRVSWKVAKLAGEPAFVESLRQYVTRKRYITCADRPTSTAVLDPDSPKKAVEYYYQVRCNVAHRGKAAYDDYEILRESLTELLPIFGAVLKAARRDARL